MWFRGDALVRGAAQYDAERFGGSRIKWGPAKTPDLTELALDPWSFTYAAIRTAVTGSRVSRRGRIAGAGVAFACLAHIRAHKSGASAQASGLRMHSDLVHMKDFLGNGLRGAIGAALSYEAMQTMGYAWVGHWEDCTAYFDVEEKHPDFVFAKQSDVCLVDAKGSSMSDERIERGVKDSWRDQVLAHHKTPLVGGGLPTEGRVFGTKLSDAEPMELTVAYGNFVASGSASGGSGGHASAATTAAAVTNVQQLNFLDVFRLIAFGGKEDEVQLEVGPVSGALGWEGGPPVSRFEAVMQQAYSKVRHEDGLGSVAVSDVLASLHFPEGSWDMRVFCHAEVFGPVDSTLHSQAVKVELPVYSRLRDTPHHSDDPKYVANQDFAQKHHRKVVRGLDGVGAIFTRVPD